MGCLELIHEMYWNTSGGKVTCTSYYTWTDTWDVLKSNTDLDIVATKIAWTDTWDVLKLKTPFK